MARAMTNGTTRQRQVRQARFVGRVAPMAPVVRPIRSSTVLRGGQGDNGRAVVTRIIDIFGGLVLMMALAGLAALLGGCTETRYVAVPVPQAAPATPLLQACADHAAKAQRKTFGDSFRALQFDAAQLVMARPEQKVGSQKVGLIYDGNGQWFGKPHGTMGEWRAVRFHCMVSNDGNVLYSFLRAE